MECDFIQRVVRITLLLAFLGSLFITLQIGFIDGSSFLLGALWSCLNLLFIRFLVQNIFIKDFSKIGLTAIVKFPILYFAGYIILTHMSLLYATLGSLCIFAAFFLNSMRNVLGTTALFVLATTSLHASLDTDVPEVPNIFSLLHHIFDSPLTAILHDWENFIFATLVGIALSILFYSASRNPQLVPDGLQNFVESIVEVLRNFVVEILGREGEKFVPFLGSLFVYIVAMNWLAIVPFMKPPTASINITIALAICVFAFVQYLNIKNWGITGFFYHMAGSPKDLMGWLLVPLMLPIELLTQISRPFTLALRLFGNVVGEDILIGAAALFGVYLLSSSEVIGGLPAQLPFLFLAILTGLMQALVFTLLSTIYILLSMPEQEEH